MVNVWLDKEKELKDLSLEEFARGRPLQEEEKASVSTRSMPTVVFGVLRRLVREGHFRRSIAEAGRIATFLGVIKMRYDPDIERLVERIDALYEEYPGHDQERNIKYATRLKSRKSHVSVTERTRGMCGELAMKLDLPLGKVTGLALIYGLAASKEWIRERDLDDLRYELSEFNHGMKASLGIIDDKPGKDKGTGASDEGDKDATGE